MAEEIKFDVAVIGAGPAGIMAAIEASRGGASVVLVEKNSTPGRKMLLTGNGRCNLANAEFNLRSLVGNYDNGEFLFHAFSCFGPKETISFFEELGVKTKVEDNKRVFPAGGKSEDVLSALQGCLADNNVKVIFNSEVAGIECKGKKVIRIILNAGGLRVEIEAKEYVLSTGGKSYSSTGSDGSGYKLAEKIGHTIKKPMPALCPVAVKEGWVKDLQGISLNAVIRILRNGKKQAREEGEILFTHFGLSGPAVLNASGKIGDLLETGETAISVDVFPLLNHDQLSKKLEGLLKEHASRTVKNILSVLMPERLAEVLLKNIGIDKNQTANSMSKAGRQALVKYLKDFRFAVKGLLGFEQARVTKGGVSVKEIDHKTMKSKIADNLFFAGEIIDVNGKSGGFNLQACWSTGRLAGKSASEAAID